MGILNALWSSDSPEAPDFSALAEQTTEGNLDILRYITDANNVNQVTPWGNLTYTNNPTSTVDQAGYDSALGDWEQYTNAQNTYNNEILPSWLNDSEYSNQAPSFESWYGSTYGTPIPTAAPNIEDYTSWDDNWTATTTLSPDQQALLDLGNQTQLQLGQLGLDSIDQIRDLFSNRFDPNLGEIEQFGSNRQNVIDAMMSRTNTDVSRARQTKQAELIASGIPPSSEAYDREMERFDRRLTDARQQAEISATGQALTEQNAGIDRRRQIINEMLTERQTPLNEINAFRTGNNVGMPQWAPTTQMPYIQGPDYLGAGQAQYNADLAGWNADQALFNNILQGGFTLGAAGIMSGGNNPWDLPGLRPTHLY